jgi:hypothetical protein
VRLDFVGRDLGKLDLEVLREYFSLILNPESIVSVSLKICPNKNYVR